jgi:hypothetical protein
MVRCGNGGVEESRWVTRDRLCGEPATTRLQEDTAKPESGFVAEVVDDVEPGAGSFGHARSAGSQWL